MKNILILLTLLLISSIAYAQTMGTMTDPRDGQVYKTVSFENVLMGTSITWMAQNLNYKMSGSYAYDNNEQFRKGIGLLYTWAAAKKACPTGWHLPSDGEWAVLINQFGGDKSAGEALKSTQGWNENGNGSNSSGFNALPAGYRNTDGTFDGIGKIGYFWSSTAKVEGYAWECYLEYSDSEVNRSNYGKDYGNSCRCLRD